MNTVMAMARMSQTKAAVNTLFLPQRSCLTLFIRLYLRIAREYGFMCAGTNGRIDVNKIIVGDFILSPHSTTLTWKDKGSSEDRTAKLSPKQTRLLARLMETPLVIIAKQDLHDSMFILNVPNPGPNDVKVQVFHIRMKASAAFGIDFRKYLVTSEGGYYFQPNPPH